MAVPCVACLPIHNLQPASNHSPLFQLFLLFSSIFLSFSFFLSFLPSFLLSCCVGSLLLHTGFLQLRRAGATLRYGARASPCGGFSCCGARALGAWASVVAARGLSSCDSWALERRLSSCGARAQLLCGMWDLPGPGLEPMSPALAVRFLTAAPPRKSSMFLNNMHTMHSLLINEFQTLSTDFLVWQRRILVCLHYPFPTTLPPILN